MFDDKNKAPKGAQGSIGPSPFESAPAEAPRSAAVPSPQSPHGAPAVQRRAAAEGVAPLMSHWVDAPVQEAARAGTSGAGGALPHLQAIQRSFGRHDVSGVRAHTGAEAAAGARAMGAEAFATGDHVAFAGTPSLHTAAHEAAHVVQQRGGVQLKGGVGQKGDAYERHADAVADEVVAGRSAEPLLAKMAGDGTNGGTNGGTSGGTGGGPGAGGAVQRQLDEKGLITDAKADALAGGSKFREGGSTLKPLIKALRRYRKHPGPANLKAVEQERGGLPQATLTKYATALGNLDQRIAAEKKTVAQRKGESLGEDVDGEDEALHARLLHEEIESLGGGQEVSAKPPDFEVEHHTKTLDEVAAVTGAKAVQDEGVTGKGVHVAIIDSGYFPHPYFKEKYPKAKIDVVRLPAERWPGDPNPKAPEGKEGEDLNGHGTAMVANVLAMAPDARITMIVCVSDKAALKYALSLGADVISVSRGPTIGAGKGASNDPIARSELLDEYKGILDEGKRGKERQPIVLDAVGNMGAAGLLSLLPGVISVGGVHADQKGRLAATSYTNAYDVDKGLYVPPASRPGGKGSSDSIIGKTQVPDIAGLCGTEEHPDYLALPTQPGSELERKGTPGWGLASGSSCATPQVAGACALLKQVDPDITTEEAVAILRATATPVERGRGHDVKTDLGRAKLGEKDVMQGLDADGDWSRLIDVEAAVIVAVKRARAKEEGDAGKGPKGKGPKGKEPSDEKKGSSLDESL